MKKIVMNAIVSLAIGIVLGGYLSIRTNCSGEALGTEYVVCHTPSVLVVIVFIVITSLLALPVLYLGEFLVNKFRK